MRIIHTADWHLGNAMDEIDRTEEHQQFLDWLRGEISETGADALVVSGDIFDTKRPSIIAKKLYYSFLASLLKTDCRNVVVVGGNHDSGDLLDVARELAEPLNIHVVGSIENRTTEEMIFMLKDQNGECGAILAAVPFLSDMELHNFYTEDCDDKTFSDIAYAAYYQTILAEVEKRKQQVKQETGREVPVILTGHLYAAGLEGRYGEAGDDEAELKTDDGIKTLDYVGKLGKVHSHVFPKEFTYVALGHIHYSTRVGGENRIRYSGSPFVMGFDEARTKHHILQVDFEEQEEDGGFEPRVKPIRTPENVLFRLLEGTKEKILDDLREIISNTEEKRKTFIELRYRSEDSTALRAAVDELTIPDHIQIVSWKSLKGTENSHVGLDKDYSMEEMKKIEMDEIVRTLAEKTFPFSVKAEPIQKNYKKAMDNLKREYKEKAKPADQKLTKEEKEALEQEKKEKLEQLEQQMKQELEQEREKHNAYLKELSEKILPIFRQAEDDVKNQKE